MLKQQRTQQIAQKKPKQPVEGLFCNFPHRTCMHNRLEGYEYCAKHILEDQNAPFKQCGFTSSKSSRRCSNAAPKHDRKDGYCAEHTRRALALRHKSSRKQRPKESAESLLGELDHFKNDVYSDNHKGRANNESLAGKVLDYASSSDSDAETPTVEEAWRGDVDSDAESVDSDQEDLLKYSGIYTAEEVALIMRDKLIRLQSLYIDQFKRLQHIMKEKRRKYLQTHKREKETYGSLAWYKDRPETRDKYAKLKASKRYHKRHGKEALLHRQSKQRRIAVSEGVNYRPPSYPKCIFQEEGTKCPHRAVPLSKFCADHIMIDHYQVLYRPCQFGNGACGKPVITQEHEVYCQLHTPINDSVTRYPLPVEDTDEELEVDREDLINKEMLLSNLEALGSRDNLAHLMSINPELPESIFSTDGMEEQTGADSSKTSSASDLQALSSDRSTPVDSSFAGTVHGNPELKPDLSGPSTSTNKLSQEEEKLAASGPLLLQHLQGKVDLSSIHSRRRILLSSSAASVPGQSDLQTSNGEGTTLNSSTANCESNSFLVKEESMDTENGS